MSWYQSDPVSKTDLVLCCGIFTKGDNYKHFQNIDIINDRFAIWKYDSYEWVNSVGGYDYLGTCVSNNHLIPANKEIKNLIKKISKDDYVNIKGYLVYTTWNINYGNYT